MGGWRRTGGFFQHRTRSSHGLTAALGWVGFLLSIASSLFLTAPASAQPGHPLAEIEHWMGELNVRVVTHTVLMKAQPAGNQIAIPAVTAIQWQPRPDDGEWPSPFPQNSFYDKALRADPDFGVELVKDLREGFFGQIVWTYHIPETGQTIEFKGISIYREYVHEGFSFEGAKAKTDPDFVSQYYPNWSMPERMNIHDWIERFLPGDFGDLETVEITNTNYLTVYAQLKAAIQRLKIVGRDVQSVVTVIPNHSPVGPQYLEINAHSPKFGNLPYYAGSVADAAYWADVGLATCLYQPNDFTITQTGMPTCVILTTDPACGPTESVTNNNTNGFKVCGWRSIDSGNHATIITSQRKTNWSYDANRAPDGYGATSWVWRSVRPSQLFMGGLPGRQENYLSFGTIGSGVLSEGCIRPSLAYQPTGMSGEATSQISADCTMRRIYSGSMGWLQMPKTSLAIGKDATFVSPPAASEHPSEQALQSAGSYSLHEGWTENIGWYIYYPDFEQISQRMRQSSARCSSCGSNSAPGGVQIDRDLDVLRVPGGTISAGAFSGLSSGEITISLPSLFTRSDSLLVGLPTVEGIGEASTEFVGGVRNVPDSQFVREIPWPIFSSLPIDVTDARAYGAGTGSIVIHGLGVDQVADAPLAHKFRVERRLTHTTPIDATNPYSTSTIEHFRETVALPNGMQDVRNTLRVSTVGTCNEITELVRTADREEYRTGWDAASQSFLRTEVTQYRSVTGPNGEDRVEKEVTVSGPDNVIVSRSVTLSERFGWGMSVIEERRGTAPNETVAKTHYYTNSQSTDYGKVKATVDERGYWEVFEYNADGSVARIARQTAGNTLNLATAVSTLGSTNAETQFLRTAVDVDGDGNLDNVETTTDYLLGVAVSRQYQVGFGIKQTLLPGVATAVPMSKSWQVRCAKVNPMPSVESIYASAQADIRASTHAIDEVFTAPTFGSPAGVDRTVELRRSSSGRLSWTTELVEVLPGTSPGTSVPTGSVRRTSYSGIANAGFDGLWSGTRSETVTDASNVTLSSTTSVWTGSTWANTHTTAVTEMDELGRVEQVQHEDGTFETRVYGCCGLASSTDRLGTTTSYTYDALKRVTSRTVQTGVNQTLTTTTVYDADGRVLREYRLPAGPEEYQTANVYDTAGRLLSTTNADHQTTNYDESIDQNTGHLISKQLLPDPDGPTQTGGVGALPRPEIITESTPDGSLQITHGSGSVLSRSELGLYSGPVTAFSNLRTTTSYTGYYTEWVQNVSDALGRPIATIYADGAMATTTYRPRGVRRVDADGVTTITVTGHGTDDWVHPMLAGNMPDVFMNCSWTVSGIDVDRDGVLDSDGTDRMSIQRSWIGPADAELGLSGTLARISESAVWLGSVGREVTITGRSESRLDGKKSLTVSFGQRTIRETVNNPNAVASTVQSTTTDPLGNVTIETTAYGRAVSVERKTQGTTFDGRTENTYDTFGRLTSRAFVRSLADRTQDDVTDFTYDAMDRVLTTTTPDPRNGTLPRRTTRNTYDYLGRVIMVEHGDPSTGAAGGPASYTAYTARGEVASQTGFNVNPVQHVYDDAGRLKELRTFKDANWSPAGMAKTTWHYSPLRGWLTAKEYDDQTQTTYTYTPAGRMASRTWARNVTTSYGYSDAGDMQTIVYSDTTPDVAYTFDRAGRRVTIDDAAGLRTIDYNDIGQVLTEEFDLSPGTGRPNLLAGVVVSNVFNSSEHFRTSHEVTFGWTNVSPRLLNSVEYGYDNQDRLSTVIKDQRRVTYAYEAITGRMTGWLGESYNPNTQIWDESIETTRTYDRLGQLKIVENDDKTHPGLTARSFEYTVDMFGRRIRQELDDNTYWEYAYDALGQVIGAKRRINQNVYVPGHQFEYEYDQIGNRTSTMEGGDIDGLFLDGSTYTSNSLNQYTQRTVRPNTYVAGNSFAPLVLVNGGQAERYGDLFYRQTELVSGPTPQIQQITVQEVPGNINRETLAIPADPQAFTYDADGNLTSDGLWTYVYDAENRLIRMIFSTAITGPLYGSAEALAVTFDYDHMGRRIAKAFLSPDLSQSPQELMDESLSGGWKFWSDTRAWRFVYDGQSGSTPNGSTGWNLSASYMVTSATYPATGDYLGLDQSMAWGLDLSQSESGAGGIGGLVIVRDERAFTLGEGSSYPGGQVCTVFPMYDGNGNIVSMRDGGGYEQAGYQYGPFGQVLQSRGPRGESNTWRFSTKYADAETGLVYYGHRYYSAGLGRWINRDPIGELDTPSVYQAHRNAAIEFVDATGLYSIDFHYYAIYYLMRSVCYDTNISDVVAFNSQWIDNSLWTDPLILGFYELIKNNYESYGESSTNDLRDYHFWGSTPNSPTTRNPKTLVDRVVGSLRQHKYREAGRWLHTYADTWAHEGFTAWPSVAINKRLDGTRGRILRWIGHVDTHEGGHAPDNPYNDVGKAMEAALAIRNTLKHAHTCSCDRDVFSFALSESTVYFDLYRMFSNVDTDESRSEFNAQVILERFGERPIFLAE